MKTFARHSAFWVLLSLLLAPLAVSHASPPLDYEHWQRDHHRPAAKLAHGASSEYIVRIIHFVPRDRTPQGDINTRIDALIKHVQQWYADEMQRHGFGRKTFRLETDTAGKVVVHRVTGKFDNAHYYGGDRIAESDKEVNEQLGKSDNILYLIWIDLDDPTDVWPQVSGGGAGDSFGGTAWIIAQDFDAAPPLLYIRAWTTIAHELGHAFGLPHDFRDDRYMLSYGDYVLTDQLSQSAAEWLDAHRYFNTSQTSSDQAATIRMLSPSLASPPNTIRLRFTVTDPDGLHLARLITLSINPQEQGHTVLDGKSLNGESGANEIEFVTTELATRSEKVGLSVIDVHGNFHEQTFPIDVASLRPASEVVSIPDAELAAAIRENLSLASGAAITKLDMLDLTTLNAPNRDIADLTGLEHATNLRYVNLNENQISNLTPFEELTRVTSLLIIKNQISDLTPLANSRHLSEFWIWDNQISDLTPLAGLRRLSALSMGGNRISDLAPLARLTKLRSLSISGNQITDISPIAGLTLLGELFIYNNQITDISPIAKLVNLELLSLWGNQISDRSLLAGWVSRGDELVLEDPTVDASELYSLLDTGFGAVEPQAWLTPDPAEVEFYADDTAWKTFTVHTNLDSVLVRANPSGSDPAIEIAGGQRAPTTDYCPAEGNDQPTRGRRDGWSLHVKACQAGRTKILLIDYYTDEVVQRYEVNVEASTSASATTALNPSYPNPFNSETILSYTLKAASDIRLEVFALNGQRVAILHEGFQAAGYHTIAMDASDLASGVYLYRLTTPDGRFVQKFTLLR